MTVKQKNLWRACGWFLGMGLFVLVAVHHATGDLSRLERPSLNKMGQAERALYKWGGRRALVAVDIGFVLIAAGFCYGSLRRALVAERPDTEIVDEALAQGRVSLENSTCACCGGELKGVIVPYESGVDKPPENLIGHQCQWCKALFCDLCAREKLGFSWWSGLRKTRCGVCGARLGPGAAVCEDKE